MKISSNYQIQNNPKFGSGAFGLPGESKSLSYLTANRHLDEQREASKRINARGECRIDTAKLVKDIEKLSKQVEKLTKVVAELTSKGIKKAKK